MRLTLPRMKGTATNTLRAKPSPSPTLNRLHSDHNFGADEKRLQTRELHLSEAVTSSLTR
jgi:hypothetical protein